MERQRRLEEVLRQKRQASSQSESITDQEMDDIFGFLPKMVGGQEGQAPMGFEVREQTGCPDVIREGRVRVSEEGRGRGRRRRREIGRAHV